MRVLFSAMTAILGVGAVVSPAFAEGTFSYNIGATTDYVFRGISQTNEDPAVQGGLDYTDGSLYVGTWASNVDFSDSTKAEIDLYGGLRPTVGAWTFDVGAIAYLYTNQPSGADYNYAEAKLGVSHPIGDKATAGLTVFYSPDFFGAEDDATYLVGDFSYKATDKLSLSAQAGKQWVSSDADYTQWNVGGTYALTDKIALDVHYYDTDAHDWGDIYGDRVVGSIKFTG